MNFMFTVVSIAMSLVSFLEYSFQIVHFGFFEVTVKMLPYSTWHIIEQIDDATPMQLFDSGQILKNLKSALNSKITVSDCP